MLYKLNLFGRNIFKNNHQQTINCEKSVLTIFLFAAATNGAVQQQSVFLQQVTVFIRVLRGQAAMQNIA